MIPVWLLSIGRRLVALPWYVQVGIGLTLLWGVSLGMATAHGRTEGRMDIRDSIHVADLAKAKRSADSLATIVSQRAATVDTAQKKVQLQQPKVTAAHAAVEIVDATHLRIHPAPPTTNVETTAPVRDSVIEVPKEVTQRFVVDSQAIALRDSLDYTRRDLNQARVQLDAIKDSVIAKEAIIKVAPTVYRPTAKQMAGIAAGGYLVFRLAEYVLIHHK